MHCANAKMHHPCCWVGQLRRVVKTAKGNCHDCNLLSLSKHAKETIHIPIYMSCLATNSWCVFAYEGMPAQVDILADAPGSNMTGIGAVALTYTDKRVLQVNAAGRSSCGHV